MEKQELKNLTPEMVEELRGKPLRNDYMGKKFGRLLVLYELPRRLAKKKSKQGKQNSTRMMMCKCDCGTYKSVILHRLVHNLTKSCGCLQREMAHKKNKRLVFGIGINDSDIRVRVENKDIVSYSTWVHMLERCYTKKYQSKYPTYQGCKVCNEWLYFSNFKEWFDEHYREDYHLDKDILVSDNKVYSPDTCCFVPPKINTMMSYSVKGKITGVHLRKAGRNRTISDTYEVSIRDNKVGKHIGSYKTLIEAVTAYKQAKESQIKNVANMAYNKGEISIKVLNALLSHKVDPLKWVATNHPESLTDKKDKK